MKHVFGSEGLVWPLERQIDPHFPFFLFETGKHFSFVEFCCLRGCLTAQDQDFAEQSITRYNGEIDKYQSGNINKVNWKCISKLQPAFFRVSADLQKTAVIKMAAMEVDYGPSGSWKML